MVTENELALAEDFREQARISVELCSAAVSVMEQSRTTLVESLVRNGAKGDMANLAVDKLIQEQREALNRALAHFSKCDQELHLAKTAFAAQNS